jgi:hypothetical protein
MDRERLLSIVSECAFSDGGISYAFHVHEVKGHLHLQATYLDRDVHTGAVELQYTRRWPLSPHMTRSEVVQTVFKCCATSMEHRAREAFQYRGRRVFGPHFNVDALWELSGEGDDKRESAALRTQGATNV